MKEGKPIQAPKNAIYFKEPMLVPRRDAVRFLWGDEESHFVADLVYGRGDRLAALIYKLAPGERFGSSKTWRPLYDQDRYYYVVQGELTIQDPETGDVAVARAGEAVYWRGMRYHYGYNFGTDEVFVLDWYAPQERAANVPEIETRPHGDAQPRHRTAFRSGTDESGPDEHIRIDRGLDGRNVFDPAIGHERGRAASGRQSALCARGLPACLSAGDA
jgi:hypothetical protein